MIEIACQFIEFLIFCTVKLSSFAAAQCCPRQLYELQGHKEEIMGVALSDDKKWTATCSRDNSLRLWNTETGTSCLRIRVCGCISHCIVQPFTSVIETSAGSQLVQPSEV